MSILSSIHEPNDVKKIKKNQLQQLAKEIRGKLIEVTTENGGHLASNLGMVELTIALHRVFDSPNDKIIFDVSHQTYTHKLLTGRNDEKFLKLRLTGGYGGFSNPDESEHDAFIAGHAGTALSVALGIAYARDRMASCCKNHVIAILGDASLSCGMTLEALNSLASTTRRLIVVVNDNEFSIGKSVGAISLYLNKILRSKIYKIVTVVAKKILGGRKFGRTVICNIRNLKRAIKSMILPTSYFEYYGLRYFGPIDGHNISHLEEIFEFCKRADAPVLVHVKTTKGKGFPSAMDFPEKFHGIDPSPATTGDNLSDAKKKLPGGEILGRELMELACKDRRIVAVVAAMAYGTGLAVVRDNLPDQYVDVGIAEEHAVTFSAALAKSGMHPVCAIYSTFLQRGFDQILHDVCLQNLPVIFCLDRAGVAARDGATHHGIFDLSYLRLIPNAVILQPKDAQEFINMLHSAFAWNCPVFIRYQKFYPPTADALKFSKFLPIGQSEELVSGEKVCFISLGNMIDLAYEVANKLRTIGTGAGIVNAMFAKPLDEKMLLKVARSYEIVVTLEDNVLAGGFGSAILEFFSSSGANVKVLRVGWPDKFINHGSSVDILRAENGISVDDVLARIVSAME
ncbi:MAG: 1-deoxy-D-xylulose-5-phosphate synthase [Puniceicoccales bacterium]|jgi:1-deoxy-D-xylulose-5-phosphate synthase|nr:1-deoxy-D-xylulose-5-phosphate synthase [Puniceicoccales bacterium]